MGRRHANDVRQFSPPPAGVYLVHWFHEISRGRGVGPAGYLPISAREINDWCILRSVRLLPWETDALLRLDEKFLSVIAEP